MVAVVMVAHVLMIDDDDNDDDDDDDVNGGVGDGGTAGHGESSSGCHDRSDDDEGCDACSRWEFRSYRSHYGI